MPKARETLPSRVKKRVTIGQVARAARVSTQTVSRVVNDHPSVAPRTRARVQRVIARLSYQPNILARSLVHRRSHSLGVVTTGLEYFGPSGTLVGIEHQASQLGYTIQLSLLHRPQLGDVGQVLNSLISRQVDGIVWAVPEIGSNHSWLRRQTPDLPVPIVFISMQPSDGLPTVCVDNRAGGRMATEHLLAQGYRQVGLITGPLDWWEARERRLGWEDALRSLGLRSEERQVFEGNWSAASGDRGFDQLVSQFAEMDSVFAGNDQMALGVLEAAHRQGLRVPSDLGVVGFDDIPESAYFRPALTTVRQELRQLGGTAVQQVARMISASRGEAEPRSPDFHWLTPRLVVRLSSARTS
jgi:LacI family transcriptional regulator